MTQHIAPAPDRREIRHFHLFCGLGGGARGFNRATPKVGNMIGHFRCVGGVDVDPAGVRDFSARAGVPGTLLDLFDRDQFISFHGCEPPAGWRAATPQDIQAAAGGERPHIVFLSPPCKGFSGLLSEGKSKSEKYQALNRLTVRGLWLMLEAFGDDPPELVLLENVPRIASRGRALLDQIGALLRAYGYAVAETTHDCGELGGLAQSRKRFLLVARHMAKVPPFLYEAPTRPMRGVGTVLERLPLPGAPSGGPMHRVPALQWQTWVRLAFVEAGSDWRSLNKLRVAEGMLTDYAIAHNGSLGVTRWEEPSATVRGRSGPTNGEFSVADPRIELRSGGYGVANWQDTLGTVAGESMPSNGKFAVADPRFAQSKAWNDGQQYGVLTWDEASGAVTGQSIVGQGRYAVADPRPHNKRQFENIYRVVHWDQHTRTVIGATAPADGAMSVADPRCGMNTRQEGDHYLTGGHYGVLPWAGVSGAVSAAACHDNGRWAVADPRLPASSDRLRCVIQALDGTWHRPFTTLELAALQSLIEPDDYLEFDGLSDQAWRERIGNAVPPDTAQAIAETMGRTLLLAWAGETFMLSAEKIWVRPLAIAVSVRQPQETTP